MSDEFQLLRNGQVVGRWGPGDRLDQFLTDAIAELKDGKPRAPAPAQPEPRRVEMSATIKPPAGGLFFSLIDELEASERRLDQTAAPLLDDMLAAEAEAKVAVEARRAKVQAARDYIKRMSGVTAALKQDGGNKTVTNGGPTVEGSAASPPPSTDAPPSPPPSTEPPPAPGETPPA